MLTIPFVLYRMFAADGRLLYVGQSINPGLRFRTHRRKQSWWRDVVTITLTHYEDAEELTRAETEAIRTENPVHNVLRPGANRPARNSTAAEPEVELTPEILLLLEEVRAAREGRDLWRNVGPILVQLRDQGTSYREIKEETGISPATVTRIVRETRASMPTPTGVSTSSTATSP